LVIKKEPYPMARNRRYPLQVFSKRPLLSLLGMIILLSSFTATGTSFTSIVQPSMAQTLNCADIPLSGGSVSASGSDGNLPSNVVDNNLNTRWSNLGIGSWISIDLGSTKTICSVEIAWYRGTVRQSDFVISVSTDGSSFTNVFSGRSSGTTLSPENYDFANVNARYVKVTVNGNNENSWASITEINIIGDAGSGGGTEVGVDKFGIKKLIPTKFGGEEWYMDMNNPSSDPRTLPPSMTKNSDGSWKVTNTQTRYRVFPSTGWDRDYTTLNQQELAQKGYMEDPNDWKNVEMTGYIKANTATSGTIADTTKFIWYNRGGQHSDTQPCEGTAYKGNLFYDGRTRFQKEQWHDGGYFTSPTISAVRHLDDRWVGFKYVVYNFVQNGKLVVKMQNWIDDNNNGNWVKINERVDSGGWGTEGDHCGGAPDQLITWGGPLATFRWDRATNVDIKNFSIREIQPPE
jgi:hypothetical protein